MDLVRVVKTGQLAVVETVTERNNRRSCSIEFVDTKDHGKTAWYESHELEIVGNVLEVISRMTVDDRCSDIARLEIK